MAKTPDYFGSSFYAGTGFPHFNGSRLTLKNLRALITALQASGKTLQNS
jgi:hypothetical protein